MMRAICGETIRIGGAAFRLPAGRILADVLLEENRAHVSGLQARFKTASLFRSFPGFGIEAVPVMTEESRFSLALAAVTDAVHQSGVPPECLGMSIDFSTTGRRQGDLGLDLCSELGARDCVHLAIRSGGCAAFHLAVLAAMAHFTAAPALQSMLLFASDAIPRRSRYCFPLSVLGDGASAMVLVRNGTSTDWKLAGTAVRCAPSLHAAVPVPDHEDSPVHAGIELFENKLLPVYFKGLYDVVNSVLEPLDRRLRDVDFIYANMSDYDCDGVRRALRIEPSRFFSADFTRTGHIMASDMIINFCHYRDSAVPPNRSVLLAGAGGGFYWGATLLSPPDGDQTIS